MNKKTWIVIAVVMGVVAISSVAYAAVSTKYFQKIKQNTYTGDISIATTKGTESSVETHRSTELVGWTSGSLASTAICKTLIGEGQDAAQVNAGYISTAHYREYSVKQNGAIPAIDVNVDPPIFYSKAFYYKNGKMTSLPAFTTKKYLFKSVNTTVYCDGHTTSEETLMASNTLPTVGTIKYTYKLITLQPAN